MTGPRWQNCVSYCDVEAEEFVTEYFGQDAGSVLFLAGAGFDPRSAAVAERIARASRGTAVEVHAVFIREVRPKADPDHLRRGDEHERYLCSLFNNAQVVPVEVLSEDRAVIGGQRVISAFQKLRIAAPLQFTDVVLDMSALSIGISFPLASYLLGECRRTGPGLNLHLMAATHAGMDEAISGIPNDVVDPIRGFSGEIDLERSSDHPKIWLPHLASGRNSVLELILSKLQGSVDICPVLPLSPRDPTAADRLIAKFERELSDQTWNVDPRNLIYAIEDDPLDLYRTISAIHNRTKKVFDKVVPCHLVLSPSGNKVLAIGALMAALEHEIAVRYVESVGYEVDWKTIGESNPDSARLVHVWLHGQPYEPIVQIAPPDEGRILESS